MTVNEIIKDTDQHMAKSLQALSHEFSGVRTGRASSAILDKLHVEVYGSPMPINQLANVRVPEPQTLVIEPWDRNTVGAIEKAIQASDLGLNPSNDGTVIRIPFPPLNEERRKELVKLCKQYAEEARVAIRNIRHDSRKKLERAEKDSEISQDDLRRAEDEIQKVTDRHIKEIDEALKRKEVEIMEV